MDAQADKREGATEAVRPNSCFLCDRPFSDPGEPVVVLVVEDGTILLCRACGMLYEHPESCCG